MTIILFILILGAIIFVHELGHFLFAKMFNVYVHEFALGMGPKLWSKKGKETVYSLRAIPIGGFCQLAGENDEEEDKDIPKDRLLQAKKPWKRFLIMACGAIFNFLLAIVLLFIITLITGSNDTRPLIQNVEDNLPAYREGVEAGDRVISINDNRVTTIYDISLFLTIADREKPVVMVIERDGQRKTIEMQAEKVEVDGEEVYRFGIGLEAEQQTGFVNAVRYTFIRTGSMFRQMWFTIASLFTGDISVSQLSGPVGIYSLVGEQSQGGIMSILFLTAFLSINVGFINLLPLPAFDGGRIVFLIIEKVKGSPVKAKTENIIHTIGLILLMLLMIYITFQDILRLF